MTQMSTKTQNIVKKVQAKGGEVLFTLETDASLATDKTCLYHHSGSKSGFYLSRLVLAQWEDTGATTLFLAGQRYTGHWCSKKDKFVNYPAKNQDWQYSYRYDGNGALSISSKGKTVAAGTEIAIALYILWSACSLDKAIESRFGDAPKTLESFYGRKYKHLYTDLGLSEEVLESGLLYTWRLEVERPKIRAALRANNTKKARSLLAGGAKTKSLINYVIQRINESRDFPIYAIRAALSEGMDEGLVLRGLQAVPEVHPDFVLELLKQFEIKSLVAQYQRDLSIVSDTGRMLIFRRNMNRETPLRERGQNLRDYHDAIVRLEQEEKEQLTREQEAAYSKPHETELKPLGNVRPIRTINECKDIGNAMNICVGGYRRMVHEGRVDIAVLEDNGVYIACLEIKDGELVQAKLAYNRKVNTDPEVAEQVRAWCELNNLTIDTSDM